MPGLEPNAGDPQPPPTQTLAARAREKKVKYEAKSASRMPDDFDLAGVVHGWPELPGPFRAGVVAMVQAARG